MRVYARIEMLKQKVTNLQGQKTLIKRVGISIRERNFLSYKARGLNFGKISYFNGLETISICNLIYAICNFLGGKKTMLEKDLEKYFNAAAERKGYMSLKFVSPSRRGVPDRIVFGAGRCCLVEFKNGAGGRLSKLQAFMFQRFKIRGFPVAVLRTREEVDLFVDGLPSVRLSASGNRMDP